MEVQIKVDAQQAFARFSDAGIPEQVRNNLRRALPGLGKDIAQAVNAKLDARLKARTNITVDAKMIEKGGGKNAIFIEVGARWTGAASKRMVPKWLEIGTRPHVIEARIAKTLAFYWPKIGGMFFGKRVNHPGTKPYRYMEDTLVEKEVSIVDVLSRAVREGVMR